MITVHYSDRDGHELTVSGHANYDDQGRDIVCAAVSAMAFALRGYLEGYADDVTELSAETESGYCYIFAKGGVQTEAAFELTLVGCAQLAAKHPDNVTIILDSADDDESGDSREQTARKEHGDA